MAKSKPDVIGSSVVHLLREKRVAKGLSMYAVAKRARMSHSMISRVEHELCRPTLDTLLRIANGMETDLWPLIKKAEQSFETGADNSSGFPNRSRAEKPQH